MTMIAVSAAASAAQKHKGKIATALLLPFVMVAALVIFVVIDEQPASADGLTGVVCAPATTPGGTVAGFSGDQLKNAALIVAAGKEMAVPQRGWVIAVATAMTESSLINVPYGDDVGPDSRGLFQQRDHWGPLSVRMDPKGSAKLFYTQMLKVPDWQTKPLAKVAQAVQNSGLPDAYAKWEPKAMMVVGHVENIKCTSGGNLPPGIRLPSNPKAATVIKAALAQLGVPYAWGGGNAAGPTLGIRDGGVADQHGDYMKVGFDCSGLALYAYAQIGVAVPHQTMAIWRAFQPAITNRSQIQPGDLILLSTGPGHLSHHVGIYLGDDKVVEAPQSGSVVRIKENIWAPGSNYLNEFAGAVRPGMV